MRVSENFCEFSERFPRDLLVRNKSTMTTRQQPTMNDGDNVMTTRNKTLNVSALTLVICYMSLFV